jgi:O-antigen/teichoic acid export membrane protein
LLGLQTLRNPSNVQARYLRGVTWALAGALTARSATLLTSIVSARLLSASSFGALGIVQSTVGMFGVLAGAGLGLTVTKYISEFKNKDVAKAKRYYYVSVVIVCFAGATITAVLYNLAPWIAATVLDQPSLVLELQIGSFLTLFGAINGVQLGVLMGSEQFKSVTLLNASRSISGLIGVAIGASYMGLVGAIVALVIAELLAVLLSQIFVHMAWSKFPKVLVSKSLSISDVAAVLLFSIPALLSSLSIQPSLWLSNSLLVRQSGGLELLGNFVAADKWRQLLLFLPSALSINTLPLLSNLHGMKNELAFRRVLKLNITLNISAVVLPALLVVIFSHPLMGVFGSQYGSSWSTLSVLAVSAIFMVANNILGQSIVSRGLIWPRFYLDLLLGTLLLATSYWLVPAFSAIGLAVSQLISYAAVSGVLAVVAAKTLKIRSKSPA